jgi:hypothetical protein
MEFMEGGNIKAFLENAESSLPESVVLDLFEQIVARIHAFHSQKIAHRNSDQTTSSSQKVKMLNFFKKADEHNHLDAMHDYGL